MKLFSITIVIAIELFSMSSCKKDYNCVCESTVIFPAYENQNNQYIPQEIVQQHYNNTIRTRKKNAVSECKKHETSSTVNYTSAQGQGPIISTKECVIQ